MNRVIILGYEGNDPNGTPYVKDANILDYGTSKIEPKRFITKAVRKLRGFDDKAMKGLRKS